MEQLYKKLNVNVIVPKNNSLFISIIFVFLLFSTIIYIKPSVFLFLFMSILGNFLLVLFVGLVGYFNVQWAIGLSAIFIILYQASHLSSSRGSGSGITHEPFGVLDIEADTIYTPTTWSQQTITDFLHFQKTHNPNFTFDINILQQQATPAEVQYLLENNQWPWSDEVKKMYRDAIAQSSFISVNLSSSLGEAQAIYNQTAIKELLSWNSKEGTFLLHGATIGNSELLPANVNNIVRCSSSAPSSSAPSVMQKIIYTGYDSINGSLQSQVSSVENSALPSLINGFKFLKDACNPCVALSNPADYSCPFSIDTGNGPDVSPVWQNLWGLNASDANASASTDPSKFPLLNQLKKEISNATFVSSSAGADAGADAIGDIGSTTETLNTDASTSTGLGPLPGSSASATLSNIASNNAVTLPDDVKGIDMHYNIPTNMS
jgi:hypothetical protein